MANIHPRPLHLCLFIKSVVWFREQLDIGESNVFGFPQEQHERDCNLATGAFDPRNLVYPFNVHNYDLFVSLDSCTS